MIAIALGAQVVAVDVSAAARAAPLELGAAVRCPPRTRWPPSHEVTGGGAHVGLDALGSPATLDTSVRACAVTAGTSRSACCSATPPRRPLPWGLVVGQELQLLGSHGMAAVDYPAMLAMVADGRLDPARLVGSVIGLDEAGAALTAMDDPSPAGAG